jgi:hypothetical protein
MDGRERPTVFHRETSGFFKDSPFRQVAPQNPEVKEMLADSLFG